MSARSEIENTLYRYAWAYDMDELAAIAECFTEDAEVEFRDTGLKVGRPAVVAEMMRRREKYRPAGETPWHVITNVYITDESARQAKVTSWWTFFVVSSDHTSAFTGIGSYDDVFANDNGAWRISRRRILLAGER